MGKKANISKKPGEKKENSSPKTRKNKSSLFLDSPAHNILQMQKTMGNQAVQRLLKSGDLQAKLTVNQPNDKYEQEADRIADQVMRMPEPKQSLVNGHWSLGKQESPLMQRQAKLEEEEQIQTKPLVDQITPLVQRQVAPEIEEEEEEETVQPKSTGTQSQKVTPNIESRIQSLKGGGQPLSKSTRDFFEPRFGTDFSQVRVHTDSKAGEVSKSINAKAFTTGKDVFFGSGQYSPGTEAGKNLVAHELTHVVQRHKAYSSIICRKNEENTAKDSKNNKNTSHNINISFSSFETEIKLLESTIFADNYNSIDEIKTLIELGKHLKSDSSLVITEEENETLLDNLGRLKKRLTYLFLQEMKNDKSTKLLYHALQGNVSVVFYAPPFKTDKGWKDIEFMREANNVINEVLDETTVAFIEGKKPPSDNIPPKSTVPQKAMVVDKKMAETIINIADDLFNRLEIEAACRGLSIEDIGIAEDFRPFGIIALLLHGSPIKIFKKGPEKTIMSMNEAASFVKRVSYRFSKKVKVVLYACSTGREKAIKEKENEPGEWLCTKTVKKKDIDEEGQEVEKNVCRIEERKESLPPKPGGKMSFGYYLWEKLKESGISEAEVWSHRAPGHTTFNLHWRVFKRDTKVQQEEKWQSFFSKYVVNREYIDHIISKVSKIGNKNIKEELSKYIHEKESFGRKLKEVIWKYLLNLDKKTEYGPWMRRAPIDPENVAIEIKNSWENSINLIIY